MGTSSSHSGNKDNKGLLPSDYNGQQSKQEVRWQATKTGFSKYINGHGGGVAKTARNYVKAAGGTVSLIKGSKSGIRGAVNIGRLFSDIQQQGYQKTFNDLGIRISRQECKRDLLSAGKLYFRFSRFKGRLGGKDCSCKCNVENV